MPLCKRCLALFSSETKYDSGSGWPSYWAAIGSAAADNDKVESVKRSEDKTLGSARVEVTCKSVSLK